MTGKTALLVIDVQPAFMEPEPMVTMDGDDLVAKCRGLIERARQVGVSVIFVQHVDDETPNDPYKIGIHPDLEPLVGEPVVTKEFGSAFIETDLDDILKEREIRHLIVCGLATFGCVNQTVVYAKLYGYDVTVVKNAHGAHAFPGWSTERLIDTFNAAWAKGGIRLVDDSDVVFHASG